MHGLTFAWYVWAKRTCLVMLLLLLLFANDSKSVSNAALCTVIVLFYEQNRHTNVVSQQQRRKKLQIYRKSGNISHLLKVKRMSKNCYRHPETCRSTDIHVHRGNAAVGQSISHAEGKHILARLNKCHSNDKYKYERFTTSLTLSVQECRKIRLKRHFS